MSKAFKRKLLILLLILLIGAFMDVGQQASARASQPPEGAKEFGEQNFLRLVEEIIFTDQPGDWGFNEGIGEVTFSELYPVYRLNSEFPFGRSDSLLENQQPIWISVIFQDGRPANAIGTKQHEEGHFELAEIGYPSELPPALLNMRESEMIIFKHQSDEYYIYSENDHSILSLQPSGESDPPARYQSVEQFQGMLMERYRIIEEYYGLSAESSPRYSNIDMGISFRPPMNRWLHAIWFVPLLLIVTVVAIYLIRRKKPKS